MLIDALLAGMSELVVEDAKKNVFVQSHLGLDVITATFTAVADSYDSVSQTGAHVITDMFGPVVSDSVLL